MDDLKLVALFSDDELRALAGHHRLHDMGLCVCPCDDAFFKLANSLPGRDALVAASVLGAVLEHVEVQEP